VKQKGLLMSRKTVIFLCAFTVMSLFTLVSHASTSTAWYKVDDVKTILKLVDPRCVDDKVNSCQRTKYWRVYYKATSRYSPVQTLQKVVHENTPQVGAIMQMTVDVEVKKKSL
jgi:hypothetical protein